METLLRVGLGNAVVAGLLALGGGLGRSICARAAGAAAWALDPRPLEAGHSAALDRACRLGRGTSRAGNAGTGTLARLPDVGRARFCLRRSRDILLEDDPEIEDAAPAGPAAVLGIASASAERPWRGWVFLFWGAGSLLTFGVAAGRIRQFQRILRLAEPAPESLRRQVEALAGGSGWRRSRRSVWSQGWFRRSSGLWGVGPA